MAATTATDARRFDLAGKRIWVAGHRGMVGSAIVRRLASEKCEVLTADRKAVDLTGQKETEEWIAANKPDGIFLAAARVGGIVANDTRPAEFLQENLDPEQRHSRGVQDRREEADVPWLVLHLSAHGAAADPGRLAAH